MKLAKNPYRGWADIRGSAMRPSTDPFSIWAAAVKATLEDVSRDLEERAERLRGMGWGNPAARAEAHALGKAAGRYDAMVEEMK